MKSVNIVLYLLMFLFSIYVVYHAFTIGGLVMMICFLILFLSLIMFLKWCFSDQNKK